MARGSSRSKISVVLDGAAKALVGAVGAASTAMKGLNEATNAAGRAFTKMAAQSSGATGSIMANTQQVQNSNKALIQNILAHNSLNKSIDANTRKRWRQIVATAASSGAIAGNSASVAVNERQHGALARAIQNTNLAFGRISINVLSFTIALKDMATQIPILVTLFGTLAAVLVSVASAAAVAGGALAGMITGGLIQLAEEYASTMEDVEGTMEALTAFFEQIRELFVQALDPFITEENAELTISLLENVANVVYILADAADQLRDQFMRVFNAIGGHFLDEFHNIVEQLARVFVELDDTLIAMATTVIDMVVPTLDFFLDVMQKIQRSGTDFINSLGTFIQRFIEFGSTVADGMLPIISTLINVFNELLTFMNNVSAGTIQLIGLAGGLIVSLVALNKAASRCAYF